jgi:hypothetical protein
LIDPTRVRVLVFAAQIAHHSKRDSERNPQNLESEERVNCTVDLQWEKLGKQAELDLKVVEEMPETQIEIELAMEMVNECLMMQCLNQWSNSTIHHWKARLIYQLGGLQLIGLQSMLKREPETGLHFHNSPELVELATQMMRLAVRLLVLVERLFVAFELVMFDSS